jgi:nucleotide-binding universal stress UspA family protein
MPLAKGSKNLMKSEPYIVLVGMDFSELADRALAEAFDLAGHREHAEIHIVSIVPLIGVDTNLAGEGSLQTGGVNRLESELERLRAHVQLRLEAFVALVAKRGGKVSGRIVSHVRMDTPATGIAQLAADLKASLIVIGTHGRHGLARLLMGSVAETTIRYARCPVLVVPPQEEAREVKIEPACPECLRSRAAPNSQELWCAQHREHHGRRHTYHQTDRAGAETNFPLVTQ